MTYVMLSRRDWARSGLGHIKYRSWQHSINSAKDKADLNATIANRGVWVDPKVVKTTLRARREPAARKRAALDTQVNSAPAKEVALALPSCSAGLEADGPVRTCVRLPGEPAPGSLFRLRAKSA